MSVVRAVATLSLAMAVSPGGYSIWIVANNNPKMQLNCWPRVPPKGGKHGHANFYGNSLCKKYAKDFADQQSNYKGNNKKGLLEGDGRYLQNCRKEEDASWVPPKECETNTPPPDTPEPDSPPSGTSEQVVSEEGGGPGAAPWWLKNPQVSFSSLHILS